MDIKKENFNVGNFKNASPNQILDLITTNKIDQYYDNSIIGNNNKSNQLTPEKMKEALKSILLIRIIENIIYNKIKSYNNNELQEQLEFKELLSQFIEHLRFRNVFPSSANIEKINKMINELRDSINKNFNEAKNFMSLSLDIWYFVKDNELNNIKKTKKNKEIIELITPITTALTEEGIKEDERRRENEREENEREEKERKEKERKEQEKRSRPVSRQRGGNKSKLNSTRKKHKNTN
jgi:hypothetical protein